MEAKQTLFQAPVRYKVLRYYTRCYVQVSESVCARKNVSRAEIPAQWANSIIAY